MKAAISGMHGFIGRNLKNYLIKKGWDIVYINRDVLFNTPDNNNFFNIVNPNYIFHLSAYGNHSTQLNEDLIFSTNVMGTFNILGASKDCNYSKFYNISTSSVTLDILTPYAKSKLAAECIADAFKKVYGKPTVNIRPYSVFGEGEAEFRFIPKVIKCLLTGEKMIVDENATHDWIWVMDFIEGMLDEKIEIGTGEKQTNKQIIQLLQDISGKKLRYTTAQLRIYDNKDWVCKDGVKHIPLPEALEKTYKYYVDYYAKQGIKA